MTHGRKRKSTSLFCIITSHGPVPGPYMKNQREKVGAGSRRQSGTPVSAGAAGPLGPSLIAPRTSRPSPLGGEAHFGSLYFSALLQSMCLTTRHRANVPTTAPTEQLDRQPLTPSFAGTAIINNHRQGGLKSRNLFKPLTLLEARSPRSRCHRGWSLPLRPPSLSCRWPPPSCVFLCPSMGVCPTESLLRRTPVTSH